MHQFFRNLENVPWIANTNGDAGLISLVWLAHYLGMFLLVGATVFVDLRLLGFAGQGYGVRKLASQLLPWSWVGVVMLLPSGFVMFAGQATVFYPATVFHIKLIVFVLALIVGILVQSKIPQWDQMPEIPPGAKFIAAISIVLWIGAILSSLEVPAFLPI